MAASSGNAEYRCTNCDAGREFYLDDFDDIHRWEINTYLLGIDDVGPFGAYDEGYIPNVDVEVRVDCDDEECDGFYSVNVRVNAIPVYADHEVKMPQIEYFKDIDVVEVLPSGDAQIHDSLYEAFEFDPYDDDYLPELDVDLSDASEESFRLLIIAKTYMNGGHCYIGLDIESRLLFRPIMTTSEGRCCFLDPINLETGNVYEFGIICRHPDEIPYPHRNNDVLVDPMAPLQCENIVFDIFEKLLPMAAESIDTVFQPGQILDRKYILENVNCPSAGVYKCKGRDLNVYSCRFKEGRKRLKINPNYDFPITALDFPTMFSNDENVLVVLGLGRPYDRNFADGRRCYILVIGIVTPNTYNLGHK